MSFALAVTPTQALNTNPPQPPFSKGGRGGISAFSKGENLRVPPFTKGESLRVPPFIKGGLGGFQGGVQGRSGTAEEEERAAKSRDLGIEVKDGLVSMDIKNAEISDVLHEIAQKSDIDLVIGDGVEGKITIKMTGATIEDALRRFCKNRAIVFEFVPESNSYRIISVGAYSTKQRKDKTMGSGIATSSPQLEQAGQSLAHDTQQMKSNAWASGYTELRKMQPRKQTSQKMYDSKGRLLYKPGELLVRFKEGVTEKQIVDLHKSLGSIVIGRMDRLRLHKVKLKEGLSEQEAIELYSASDIVELVEKHALRYPNTTIPNDPYFGEQWGLTKIQAPEAWDTTRGSPEVIIAVIDTGVDYTHPDLSDNIWMNNAELNGTEGVDDDGNGYIDDIRGWDFAGTDEFDPDDADADPMDVDSHGTHVAGVIVAKGNNDLGVAGVCWNAKIMLLKVMADNSDLIEEWDVIEAIDYAIDNGARIVNCSFGGEDYMQTEYEAFGSLKIAGILAVCAAGNEELNTDEIISKNYPSCYDLDNIISVAASNQNDNLASFSNYGLTTVDVMAPGVNIKSTIPVETEASVTVDSTTYAASGMQYASMTDEDGITAVAYDCGMGYPNEFPSGVSDNIALIQRGKRDEEDFYFSAKTSNAQAAGAVAVIIYNNVTGNFDDWTLGTPGDWVPVVCISKADAEALTAMGLPRTVTLVNKLADSPSSYATMSGTSVAAPHVSGIAGLLLAKNPSLGYTRVKSAILDTVDRIPSVSDKMVSGGRVNALCALCSINTVPGDVSCDSNVGLDDAILALQVLSGMKPRICSARISSGVDVNGDGRIGIEEVIYVLRELSGI
ncbi:MAG: S8 family serine peptidase [Desulfobacterales bacterium]|nr:S8 family serine peptidase [Desulfobacterales bacterium]